MSPSKFLKSVYCIWPNFTTMQSSQTFSDMVCDRDFTKGWKRGELHSQQHVQHHVLCLCVQSSGQGKQLLCRNVTFAMSSLSCFQTCQEQVPHWTNDYCMRVPPAVGESSCSVFRGIAALVIFQKAVLKSALSGEWVLMSWDTGCWRSITTHLEWFHIPGMIILKSNFVSFCNQPNHTDPLSVTEQAGEESTNPAEAFRNHVVNKIKT